MSNRIRLFGLQIDALTMDQAVARVLGWVRTGRGTCRSVVTPNVDHAVLYQRRADLRWAYRSAALVLADGAPIVLAARLLRRGLPERVAGSDLIPALFDAVQHGAGARQPEPGQRAGRDGVSARPAPRRRRLRVFLLGAAPGVADQAARNIETRWPSVEVVGTLSPPVGFERDRGTNTAILRAIATARPDLLLVGLGAPKQELWVHKHRRQIAAPVALCVGATIDFLAGHRRRSPRWMRRIGLEWLHRLLSEPRRLWARYARDLWVFPQLLWQERWQGDRGRLAGAPVPASTTVQGESLALLQDPPRGAAGNRLPSLPYPPSRNVATAEALSAK